MKAALKSWKTTVVGVVFFIAGAIALSNKEHTTALAFFGSAAGFILSKDGSATHSGAPDKPNNPEPNV